MLKKVLALVMALMMVMSLVAFAGSSSEVKYNDEVVLGQGAEMETVFAKSGTTLTATVYLTGLIQNANAVQVGLKILDTSKLTYVSHNIAPEFEEAIPSAWDITEKLNNAKTIAGYYAAKNASNEYFYLAAGATLKLAEFNYNIVGNTEVNSSNVMDLIAYNNNFSAETRLAFFESNSSYIDADADNYGIYVMDPSGLDSYNLSINTPANGVATLSATTVAGGQTADLTVIPAVGYYISSVMAGEANLASSFDAYRGGTIKYAPTADTAITVTFAEINNVTEDVTTSTGMTGVDALTLPEVFRGKVNNEDVKDVSVAFGQIAPATGREVVGYGIYLTYDDGRLVTTMAQGIGPKFPAERKSSDNQFGIIFEQLKPGSYNAQTYIEYIDGIVYGIKVPFTVAE